MEVRHEQWSEAALQLRGARRGRRLLSRRIILIREEATGRVQKYESASSQLSEELRNEKVDQSPSGRALRLSRREDELSFCLEFATTPWRRLILGAGKSSLIIRSIVSVMMWLLSSWRSIPHYRTQPHPFCMFSSSHGWPPGNFCSFCWFIHKPVSHVRRCPG